MNYLYTYGGILGVVYMFALLMLRRVDKGGKGWR